MRSVYAMALINPTLSNQLTIRAEIEQRDEGPIPHLHVYHDRTRNPKKCSYIRLDKVAYSEHHKSNLPLPRDLLKEFNELMTELWTGYIIKTPLGYRPANGYEAAVYIWADTYESGSLDKFQLDDSGQLVVLDYSNLK